MLYPTFSSKDKLKGMKIPEKESANLAYLCGIFAGDGSINIREHKKDYYLKCVGNPYDETELYTKVIGPLFKDVFGFLPNIREHDSKTTYGFIIYSKVLIFYLTKKIGLPVGKKYDTLTIPSVFLKDNNLTTHFVRGLFDTDGCISFKKKYKDKPYYPVISLSSKSATFVKEVASYLKKEGFKLAELYNYKVSDKRIKCGFTVISRIDLNGAYNFNLWLNKIRFWSPKHLKKIEKWGEK